MTNFDEKTLDYPKIEVSIAKLGEILLVLKQNLCNLASENRNNWFIS